MIGPRGDGGNEGSRGYALIEVLSLMPSAVIGSAPSVSSQLPAASRRCGLAVSGLQGWLQIGSFYASL